jgi:hypothetical protein
MLEPVSWNEVIKPVKTQLDAQLRRVAVYPQLIHSCQRLARNFQLLRTLKDEGAEPVLLDPTVKRSSSIHGIERKYRKLYRLCRSLRLDFWNVNNNVIAVSGIRYRKKTIGVHLGERRPFLKFSTDPLRLTPQEFRKLLRKINGYCKEVGIPIEPFRREWEGYDEFFAVTLGTGVGMPYRSYRDIYYIWDFAEEYHWIIAPPPEGEREERNKNEEEEKGYVDYVEDVVSRMEKLIGMCNAFESLGNVMVYKVSIPLAEKAFNLQLADVADMAVVVKSGYVMTTISLSAGLPLNYLVANRILEERGVSPSFMMPDEGYRELFPKPLGISVRYVAPCRDVNLYSLLIYPKPLNQLPRIQTAKVIMTKKRIVVISP